MSAHASELRRGAQSAQRAELRVVRAGSASLIKRERSRRFAPFAMAVMLVVAAVVAATLLAQVTLAQSAFKLDRLARRAQRADALRQELLVEVSRLESPGRIERYARDRLRMIDAGGVRYVTVEMPAGSAAPVGAAVASSSPVARSEGYLEEAAP